MKHVGILVMFCQTQSNPQNLMTSTPNETTASPSNANNPDVDVSRLAGLLEEYVPKLDAAINTYPARRQRTLPRLAINRDRLGSWRSIARWIAGTLAVFFGLAVLSAISGFATIYDKYIFMGILVGGLVGTAVTVRGPASAEHLQASEQHIRALAANLRRAVQHADEIIDRGGLDRTDDLELGLRIAESKSTLNRASTIIGDSVSETEADVSL